MTATSHATRRPGLTLTEALVAMFVAAIGLLALLTLFPLGALQMSQALKDERTAQTASQADQLMRYYWKAEASERNGIQGFPDGQDPFTFAFTRPNRFEFEITNGASANAEDYLSISAAQNPNLATTPPIYLAIYSSIYRRPVSVGVGTPPLAPEPPLTGPGRDVPSFPVVIDPLGWHSREGQAHAQLWLGGRNGTPPGYGPSTLPLPLPRRTLRAFQSVTTGAYTPANAMPTFTAPLCTTPPWQPGQTSAFYMYSQIGKPLAGPLRFCSLLDDLTYDESGSGVPPTNSTGTGVERQGRYNWMAILQQPRVSDPFTVNMTIVVFDGRAPGYAPDGQELMYPRDSGLPAPGNSPTANTLPNMVVFVPGSTALRVYYAGDKPAISKGRWVMDGTLGGFPVVIPGPSGTAATAYDPDNTGFVANVSAATQRSLRHANFYRVVSATEGVDAARGGATYLDIELEKPIKPRSDGLVQSDLSGAGGAIDWTYYSGTLYVLPGVSEVFEMPPLTR